MNLSKILSLTKIPRIVSKPSITQRADNLIAILGENEMNQPPEFLEIIRDNHTIQEDLKKKKTVSLYGRNDDMFKHCYLISDTLRNTQRSLSTGACVARSLLRTKSNNASLLFSNNFTAEQISQFLNGFCLSNYKFDRKGTLNNENGKYSQLESLDIVHDKFDPEDEINKFHIQSAHYSLFCREITNTRGNEADPESMLELCKEIAKRDSNIKIEYIVGKELEDKGLNLIYQVGVGSAKPTSLICMKYEGNPNNPEDVIALVGKGVCFDSGGLNLKPTGNIEDMFHDKGGACTVLAAFKGAVEMKLPVNIVCTMVYVENLMSATSFKPKDIVRSYKGLTVEIGNTDAEGRLILADAMTYTQQVYKPKTLLEFSTLTGAVKVALGNEIAGIFSNDDSLASEIFKAGQETCEPVWRLPITDEHREDMRSNVADLNNKGRSISGGASKAAAFLENFVERGVRWAHVDMAGTSFREGEKFVYSSGATGYGVKLLLNYLKKKGSKN